MTSIEKYLHEFEAYFNGDLNAEEENAFEVSLDHNPEMKAAWNEYQSMMEAFSKKESISLRIKLNELFYRHQQGEKIKSVANSFWFRMSAAAVIIVIMGFLLYFFYTSGHKFQKPEEAQYIPGSDTIQTIRQDTSQNVDEDDSYSVPGKSILDSTRKEQLAYIFEKEEYQISPVFAELLHNVYRGNWFGLISPEDSAVFLPGDSIGFSWETNIRESLYFDVLDRHGNVVYKHPGPVSSPWHYKPQFPPAIYMFRFATEDHPVWMGVIVGV